LQFVISNTLGVAATRGACAVGAPVWHGARPLALPLTPPFAESPIHARRSLGAGTGGARVVSAWAAR